MFQITCFDIHSISIACLDSHLNFKFKLGIWIKLNEQAILRSLNLALLTFLSPITIAQQLENNISLFRSHLEIQQFQLYSGG